MNRNKHINWAKGRALEYLNAGQTGTALSSFFSDMNKHPETENHIGIELGRMMLVSGQLRSEAQIREWIDGFK